MKYALILIVLIACKPSDIAPAASCSIAQSEFNSGKSPTDQDAHVWDCKVDGTSQSGQLYSFNEDGSVCYLGYDAHGTPIGSETCEYTWSQTACTGIDVVFKNSNSKMQFRNLHDVVAQKSFSAELEAFVQGSSVGTENMVCTYR